MVGLIRFGDAEAENIVQRLASHESGDFRASAAWAMGETALPVFLPCLQGMVGDPQPKVKLNAIKALRRINMNMRRTQQLERESRLSIGVMPFAG